MDWIEQKVLGCVTPFEIDATYFDNFKAILIHLINESPPKTVCLLARYQSFDKEVVLGTFSVDEFLRMLSEKKIHANIC